MTLVLGPRDQKATPPIFGPIILCLILGAALLLVVWRVRKALGHYQPRGTVVRAPVMPPRRVLESPPGVPAAPPPAAAPVPAPSPEAVAARLEADLIALGSADPAIRAAAAQEIGALRPPTSRVAEGLSSALADPDPMVRVRAAEALILIGAPPEPALAVLRREAQSLNAGSVQAALAALTSWELGLSSHGVIASPPSPRDPAP